MTRPVWGILTQTPIFIGKTEAFTSDDGPPGRQNTAFPDFTFIQKDNPREETAPRSDFCLPADKATRFNHTVLPDFSFRLNGHKRTDRSRWSNFRRRIDYRTGMDALHRRNGFETFEQLRRMGEIGVRIFGDDARTLEQIANQLIVFRGNGSVHRPGTVSLHFSGGDWSEK